MNHYEDGDGRNNEIIMNAGKDEEETERLLKEAVEKVMDEGYKNVHVTLDKKTGRIIVEGKPGS